MKENNSIKFDTLIEEVLQDEIDKIDISDEEIEEQWLKLKEKSKHVNSSRKKGFRKVAVIIGTLLGVTMFTLPNSETSAWKVPNIINIFSNNQSKSINHNLSIGEGLQIADDEEAETGFIINSIEEARNIVSFNFRELPYDLKEGLIEGSLGGEEILYLNYKSNQGEIRLIQMQQGLEFTQSVNVGQDSDVTEIKINNTSYSIAKVSEERTKVIWSSFNIHHILDIYYPIEIEGIKEIIKAME